MAHAGRTPGEQDSGTRPNSRRLPLDRNIGRARPIRWRPLCGLLRFNAPAMTDDNIRALSVGRDGSLWIATDGGGVLQYQDGRFRSFGPNDGLASEFVGAVLEDQKGQVWAGTNRGLYVRRASRFERVDEAAHLS